MDEVGCCITFEIWNNELFEKGFQKTEFYNYFTKLAK